jgi:ribosome recycling factor
MREEISRHLHGSARENREKIKDSRRVAGTLLHKTHYGSLWRQDRKQNVPQEVSQLYAKPISLLQSI